MHEFWLANIHDPYLDLDLLACCVAITLSTEIVALQFGRGEESGSEDQRTGHQATASA